MRHMKYDMKLTAEDGNDYFFSAFKTVPERQRRAEHLARHQHRCT